MATLDTITEMQKKGMTDYEISTNLQSQGVSPKEINDGLNQARIKSAISDTSNTTGIAQPQNPDAQSFSQQQFPQTTQGVGQQQFPQNQGITQPQPSITQGITQPQPSITQEIEQPQTDSFSQPQPSIMQTEQGQNEYSSQETYPQDAYPVDQYGTDQYEGDYYDEQSGGGYTDTETITEIAEQVVAEKFKKYEKKTGDVSTFKTTIQDKVTNIEQRVKRIENTIDKLQQAILSKVGEFGENTNMIKKDLDNLHNTTSKLMNPLIDNYRELQKINERKHH